LISACTWFRSPSPRSRALFVGVLVLISPIIAYGGGGVSVFPNHLFYSYPNKSEALTITNPSDQALEVWFSFRFGYPVSFDTGTVNFAWGDLLAESGYNGARWMRAYPERIVLQAGESQNIRVIASPPAGLADREYWSRLVISSKASNPATVTSRKEALSPILVSEMIVPVHYRKGPVNSAAVLTNLRGTVEQDRLKFNFQLKKVGNAAFFGRALFELINESGQVADSRRNPLVVYDTLAYCDFMSIAGLPPGSYTFNVTVDNKHPVTKSDIRLKSPPISDSFKFTIP